MILILVAILALPLVMAALLFVSPLRSLVIRALGFAAAPALLLLPVAWEKGTHNVVLPGGWVFVLDQPGMLMLLASALLWCIGGFAASKFVEHRPDAQRLALWWLLTLTGSLGVFIAGDVVSFYCLYALASLPAYGLIVADGKASDRLAGRYALAAALLGEGLILAAFVMIIASVQGEGLAIAPALEAVSAAPGSGVVFALIIIGFGLKIGLVPLHGWMPISYAAGPLVATAVLSGATSKAGIIGMIRFLPFDGSSPLWGHVLLCAGLLSALYGAIMGLTQANPRSVLAYSSISQLGQMAAVLGAGMASGNADAASLVAFYAVFHVLIKGGLFLALGAKDENWIRVLTIIMALGFAGLPLTGGALGKLAIKPVIGSGTASLMFSIAAIGSTMLMLHFARLLYRRSGERSGTSSMAPAWLAAAIAATVLPYTFFSGITGYPLSYAFTPDVLFDLAWPIALGALLAWLASRASILIPELPAGDVTEPIMRWIDRATGRVSALITERETVSKQWQVSSSALILALCALVLLLSS